MSSIEILSELNRELRGPLGYVLATANLLFCGGAMWACICRLNMSTKETVRPMVRVQYSAAVAGAMASGFSPVLFGEWPGYGQVTMSAGLLVLLLAEIGKWTHRPPADVLTEPVPLDEIPADRWHNVPGGKR